MSGIGDGAAPRLPRPVLRRTLTTLPLVFILFFTVSGGPFTTESLVIETGPGLALLVLLLIPLLWSLPETLIIAELASMLPEEGGYYRWVRRAFGPFWAFQNGWWTWMYSLVDMAIYPVLFNQYLAFFVPGLSPPSRWAISLGVIWSATALNLAGARPVGRFSILGGAFILGGFFVMAAAAALRAHRVPWEPFASGTGSIGGLGVGLSIALWNYIGWDNASTTEGEMVDPARSYPRALAVALPLVTLGYLIPLTAALSASDWTRWSDGGWPAIAREACGPAGGVLAAWLALAGLVSAVGLFNALLLSYSRIPLAMAADGLLPGVFARTDRRGTPRAAVLLSAAFYSVFALVSFGGLVVADVLLYTMALSLEFAALVALRVREPQLRGPWRIPLGTRGVAVLAALPLTILLGVTALELHDPETGRPAVLFALLSAAAGPIAWKLLPVAASQDLRGHEADSVS